MEEEFIDIDRKVYFYGRMVNTFRNNPEISPRNKELMLSFLRDASLGKTVIGRAKKKIKAGRLVNYIVHMMVFMRYLRKDLDKVKQEDMEDFIEALEDGRILGQGRQISELKGCGEGRPFSERYKVDIKITVRKFYKWLWGESRAFPKIVEWIDTYVEDKEISALTLEEVDNMVDRARTPRQRALIQILFDGGFRIQELLNVRLRHVSMKSIDPKDESKKCFLVRVPFSKTQKRTVVLLLGATTKWLNMWLEEHPARPSINDDGSIEATDTSVQLFPIRVDVVRDCIRKVGRKVLGKRVYPHLLRHSSATYWVNRGMTYFQLCKRFGWTMTSRMPQRYIDREGVDEIKVASLFREDEQEKLGKENQRLQDELAAMKERLGREREEE